MKTMRMFRTLSYTSLRPSRSAVVAAFSSLIISIQAAAPWGAPNLEPGIAVVSCAPPTKDVYNTPIHETNAFVVGLFDFRNPPPPMYGPNGFGSPLWNPPMYHHESWNARELGNVFGTETDEAGNLYVAAHGLYTPSHGGYSYYNRYGDIGGGASSLAAAGTIYRMAGADGVPTVFAVLPQQAMALNASWNSGPGIGNLAYDAVNDQFFATNLEDGRIYRIDNSGALVPPAFDPLGLDSGAAGLPPAEERLWGIEVYSNQLYYAVWNTGDVADPGTIRRVDLDGSGAILPATDVEILIVPGSSTMWSDWNTLFLPVSDIEFSADGQTMILGQRSMRNWGGGYLGAANHAGKVMLATLSGSTWSVVRTLETGNSWGHGETYGGVAWGPEGGVSEQVVWSTSADTATAAGPHGLQGTRAVDFPVVSSIVSDSFRVPFDPAYTTSGPDYKGTGGDVDIVQEPLEEPCSDVLVEEILCPEEPDVPYSIDLTVVNHSTNTVQYVWLTPCPSNDLPSGAITLQPQPVGITSISTPAGPGDSFPLNIEIDPSASGQEVCFRLTLLSHTGDICCTQKVCIELPPCDCGEILETNIECEEQADGTIKYILTFDIKNSTHLGSDPFDVAYVTFLPPSGFDPTYAIPVPDPILPGGTGTVETCYYGVPGMLYFTMGLHGALLEECCLVDVGIELPECEGVEPGEPDECKLKKKTRCRKVEDLPYEVATTTFTICNNSTVSRTYTWTANPIAEPGCNIMLPPTAFSPASGTIGPVLPGDCATLSIDIACEDFEPGDCAAFEICAQFNDAIDPVCCRGQVFRPETDEPHVDTADKSRSLSVLPGVPGQIDLIVSNPTPDAIVAELIIWDEIGIIGYPTAGGETNVSQQLQLDLAAGSTVTNPVELERWDDGRQAPDYTQLFVADSAGGKILFAQPVALKEGITRAFSIDELAIEAGPPSMVTLEVESRWGYVYRVEESTNLVDWVESDGSLVDPYANDDGTFNGNGLTIECCVPCDLETNDKRFYRVVEQEK